MKTMGERIVFLRERYDMTQKELAQKANITEASLSRYENNLREPKAETIVNLAMCLNTSADFLLGCSNNPVQYSGSDDNDLTQSIHTLSEAGKNDLQCYIDLLIVRDAYNKHIKKYRKIDRRVQ